MKNSCTKDKFLIPIRKSVPIYEQEKALWVQEMNQLFLQIREQVDQAKGQSALSRTRLDRFRQRYHDISQEVLKLYPPKPQNKKRGRHKQTKAKKFTRPVDPL